MVRWAENRSAPMKFECVNDIGKLAPPYVAAAIGRVTINTRTLPKIW